MTSEHSFDPRTWLAAARPKTSLPGKLAAAPSEAATAPAEPARAGSLGLALSVTILLAGAAAAYAMRPSAAPIDTVSLSDGASASG